MSAIGMYPNNSGPGSPEPSANSVRALRSAVLVARHLASASGARPVGWPSEAITDASTDGALAAFGWASTSDGDPRPQAAEKGGRTQYLRHCHICHGFDGRALENIDFEATDLTDPERWRFGTTDGDLFRSTKYGAGLDMPPFEAELDDTEIWELVHYLRSIGPEEYRAAAEPENPP